MVDSIKKGICIITNHFKEVPVYPKIVYANKGFLNLLGAKLEDVVEKNPSTIFSNWNQDQFIQEIVTAVDQKISWVGELEIIGANKTITKKKFVITPVFNLSGGINYYSCSTDIESCLVGTEDDNVCLDKYISSMTEIYEHFQEVCEKSPANLLRIDIDGNITYLNGHTQQHFGLTIGMNFFDLLTQDDIKIKKHFNSKNIIGKVSKLDFDFFNIQEWSVQCKFWPITDDENNITGYSMVLFDNTKKKDIARQFLALKGN